MNEGMRVRERESERERERTRERETDRQTDRQIDKPKLPLYALRTFWPPACCATNTAEAELYIAPLNTVLQHSLILEASRTTFML